MKELENQDIKRTQKDNSFSSKLVVTKEFESVFITQTDAMHKYGILGYTTINRWCKKLK